MDSTVTNWAFGFGGWVGVLGSTYMLLNVPHNYTFGVFLLSPWLGGISVYLLMYMTHSWMRVSAQIAAAMVKYEIIMALFTSTIGVMIVAIARLVIDMERGHKTPAEQAATETQTQTTPESDSDMPINSEYPETTETVESDSVADASDSEESDDSSSGDTGSDDSASDDSAASEDETSGEEGDEEGGEKGEEEDGEEGDEESGEEGGEESGEEGDDEESSERTNDSANQARIEETSFENINTPQLNGIPNTSPIPKLLDI